MFCTVGTIFVKESVLKFRFHVSSTVTVTTSAIHISPRTSMREALSGTSTKMSIRRNKCNENVLVQNNLTFAMLLF